jgi:hypothetical protein
MNSLPVIIIRPATEEGRRLWNLVLSLAVEFGPDREWSLIGGLMVQLYGFEHGDDLRATADIDVLGGARRPPRMTEAIAELLVERGAEVATPPRSNPELGYRFEFEGETIELLGPDGLRHDPKTIAGLRTFQAAGGSQALQRTEVVMVSLDGAEPNAVRRPNLLGAILIKARVVTKRREGKYASDRQDLIRLLGYVEDPRGLADGDNLKSSERKWLRNAEVAIDFDDGSLSELFPEETLVRARQAVRLLSQAGSAARATK